MKTRATLILITGFLLAVPTIASAYGNYDGRCRPVGSWLVEITFPDAGPPGQALKFKQLLVLNADRTLQETNASLHPNTPPFAAPPGAPATTGSDGVGTWKRLRGCRIQFSFLKLVFAGEAGMPRPDAPPPPPEGVHIGYLKVSGIARIVGNTYLSESGDVRTEMIQGNDPFAPEAMRMDFGRSVSEGMRLLFND